MRQDKNQNADMNRKETTMSESEGPFNARDAVDALFQSLRKNIQKN